MKKIIFLLGVLGFLVSCEGEKGGKKRRIYYPQNEQELEHEVDKLKIRNIRIASLKAEKLEVNLKNEGILDSRKLNIGRNRYLREKILGQAFENIYNQKEKQGLLIDASDERKFFPNELSFETKLITSEAIQASESKSGSWSFNIKMSWRGLLKDDSLSDILISLGSVDKKTKVVGQYGTDLIKKENGLTYSFDNKSGMKKFNLKFEDVPLSLMNSIVEPNTKIFFEIKDFKMNKKGMKEFYQDQAAEMTRLIISLPYGEKLYWLNKGEKLEDFLTELDPSFELNYDHSLLSLFGHLQDEVFSYPDRNILNDESIDDGLNFWWSNKEGDFNKIKADGSTIVLTYFSLKEIKKNQEVWLPLRFDFKESIPLKVKDRKGIIGKVKKYSVEYRFQDSEKQIPFEIGKKVCMEDNRFERKGGDCTIHWNPAFSYPVAHFRRQIVDEKKEREIFQKEILIKKNDREKEANAGWLEVKHLTNETLEVKKESLNAIGGGFVGWKSYDSRLNGYQVRAPHDNLASYEILNGFENEYEFKGWKLMFPAKH